jgi:hypothetical protein
MRQPRGSKKMKKYIAVTTDGQIVGDRATKKEIQSVAQQQAKQLQEVIQVKQYDPWTDSYVLVKK